MRVRDVGVENESTVRDPQFSFPIPPPHPSWEWRMRVRDGGVENESSTQSLALILHSEGCGSGE